MEKHIEVIGIDHGWSNMKTVTQIFTTGVKEITTEPAFYDDVVELDGKYYKVGGKRLEVRDTKVENDNFYLLTLAAVAKELKQRGMREAGQKIANTFRTFADKPEKEYGEKKFSKTELIKKPFQAKRKLLSGILNCADAAIEKTERLAADVKQYQTDKAERETAGIGNAEAVNPVELAVVAEPEFQCGAEAFEAHQKETEKAITNDKITKNMPVKSGKSR